jgi:hypothetical protein
MLPIGHVPTQIYANKTCILHYNLAIIFIYFVEYIFFYIFFMHYRQFGKLPGFKAKTLLELPFSCGNWSCSTQDLSETKYLQNNEPARQKGVHDYVVNTLNLFCKGI